MSKIYFYRNCYTYCIDGKAIKFLIIIILFFFSSCSHRKLSSTEYHHVTENIALVLNDTFNIQCSIPKITIFNCDTLVNSENYKWYLIRCFDKFGHLLKTDSLNLSESNIDKIYNYEKIYDTSKNLLYESVAHGLIKFHCYSYCYDTTGDLIEKTGYGSGELGVKITYSYQEGKLVKEITERLGQKTEKNY